MPNEAGQLSALAGVGGGPGQVSSGPPSGGTAPPGPPVAGAQQVAQGPAGPGLDAAGGIPGLGGPGVDTPQEQQDLEFFSQGAMMLRRAAEVDPSIRYIIDKHLQQTFMEVAKHYGVEQEGKLAMQQAQLGANRERAGAIMGPPPSGGMGPQGPQV